MCKSELACARNSSSLELKSLREELNMCKSELVRTRETSNKELTRAREDSKRLYSEIDRLENLLRENKEQQHHKSRLLLVSYLAASRARRRCRRKQNTNDEKVYPNWWCKIQEVAREDSLKYLEETKKKNQGQEEQEPSCCEQEKLNEQRPISALRSAVRTVLQRRTECRDAVLNLSDNDQNHAKMLRKQ